MVSFCFNCNAFLYVNFNFLSFLQSLLFHLNMLLWLYWWRATFAIMKNWYYYFYHYLYYLKAFTVTFINLEQLPSLLAFGKNDSITSFLPNVWYHIETSFFICTPNKIPGFSWKIIFMFLFLERTPSLDL